MGHIDGTYAACFEHWVDVQPDALAVIGDDGVRLTYGELEMAANPLANAIDDLDPERQFPCVAIALDQSTEAIVAAARLASCAATSGPACPRTWCRPSSWRLSDTAVEA